MLAGPLMWRVRWQGWRRCLGGPGGRWWRARGWVSSSGGCAAGRGGVEAESQGVDDAEDGGEFGVAVGAEGAIETLARDAGFAGNLSHAAGAGDDAERVGDEGRISCFEDLGHVGGNGLFVVEVFRRIEGFGFHFAHSVSF